MCVTKYSAKMRESVLEISLCENDHAVTYKGCVSQCPSIIGWYNHLHKIGCATRVTVTWKLVERSQYIDSLWVRRSRDRTWVAEKFSYPSHPALGPIQPPVLWVLGLSPVQSDWGVALTTHRHLPLLLHWSFMASYKAKETAIAEF